MNFLNEMKSPDNFCFSRYTIGSVRVCDKMKLIANRHLVDTITVLYEIEECDYNPFI